jgi:hypothetical protein
MEQNRPSLTPDKAGDLAFLKEKLEAPKENQVIKKLSLHIGNVFIQNQKDFKATRQKMIKATLSVNGEYDAEMKQAIAAFKGSSIFIRTGETKARAAESWIKDIYRGDQDLPWALEPTAIPDLPDQKQEALKAQTQMQVQRVEEELKALEGKIDPMQVARMLQDYYEELLDLAKEDLAKEAKERCERAELAIRDQNQEGGWNDAFKDFLYNFVRMPFGVIKGPIQVKATKTAWQPKKGGGYDLVSVDTLVTDVYAPSPFNIYPSKNMKNIKDGDLVEVHELSRQAIFDMIGVPGYKEEEIRAVLTKYDKGALKAKWFTIDDEAAVKQAQKTKVDAAQGGQPLSTNDLETELILAQEFWGTVSGRMLTEWGAQGTYDEHRQYQCNCWKIGPHVIKAIINPDSMNRKPYHFSSWAKNPNSVVGEGLIEFAQPVEASMNAIARALQNNIAIASGPMVEEDSERVPDDTPLYPWKKFRSTSRQMKNSGPAVQFYQPNMHATELISAYQFFAKVLDEMTVPAYAQGAPQKGVTGGTATVFTQLLAAAARSIKAVVANIDDDIFTPYIQMSYDHNMKTTTDPTMKGDARVVAKGINGLLAREQSAQGKTEFLQIAMTPILSQVLGARNLGALAGQIAKANNIDLPDKTRLEGDATMQSQIDELINMINGGQGSQDNGNMDKGGGKPAKSQGALPNGDKAGVNNAK